MVSRGLHSLFSVACRDLSTVQAAPYLQQQTQLNNELCPEEVESIERWRWFCQRIIVSGGCFIE
jgi:hypothetical protein